MAHATITSAAIRKADGLPVWKEVQRAKRVNQTLRGAFLSAGCGGFSRRMRQWTATRRNRATAIRHSPMQLRETPVCVSLELLLRQEPEGFGYIRLWKW